MAELGNFFARMFSAGGARGLSGDADLVLPPSPELEFYNECLRKHKTSEDFVSDPSRLWDTSTFLSRKGGLRSHFQAERGDGVASVSDVLIIVNSEDWKRTFKNAREPWVERARAALRDRFTTFCEGEDFHTLFPQRPLGFHIIEDGGPETKADSLGLQKGEFVTGLLPNLYPKPGPASRPVIALHLHLPGAWEGYQEVGRLYSDQVLFTLGDHWLDNFSHPALKLPALYRLQQYADGSFVHVINPDVADRYRITKTEDPGAPSVLTLEDDSGAPVAWIVLAVVEADSERRSPRPFANTMVELDLELPAGPSGEGFRVPNFTPQITGGRTIVPTAIEGRILTLRESGALLQKVHFNKFMEGYDVYVGPNGELGTAIAQPAATFRVRGNTVMLAANRPDVTLNGRPVSPGVGTPLDRDARIALGSTEIEYRDLSTVTTDGWPYLGEVRRKGGTVHMVFGSKHQVGRDRRCKVRLPDEPHNDNIVWKPEMATGGSIRSRNGEIPKSRFYTDSIMVASEHAEIDLVREPVIHSIARHCYTYVRRAGDVFALHPAGDPSGPTNLDLQPGDELLAGNCVFEASYPPAATARTPIGSSDSGATLSAFDLASAVDPTGEVTSLPDVPALGTTDLPSAAGLGERGAPPPAVMVEVMEVSSQLGLEAPPAPEAPPEPPTPTTTPTTTPTQAPAPTQTQTQAPAPTPTQAPAPSSPIIGPPMMLDEPTEDPSSDPTDLPSAPPPSVLESVMHEAPARPPLRPPTGAPRALRSTEPPAAPPAVPPAVPLTRPPAAAAPPLRAPSPAEDPPPIPAARTRPPAAAPAPSPPSPPPPPPPVPSSAPPALSASPPRPAATAAPSAPLPPPPTLPPAEVVIVDESDWQLELSRPARLSVMGWMVSGEVTVGNFRGADIVVPENRCEPGQRFEATRYFQFTVRGKRGSVRRLSEREARLEQGGTTLEETRSPDSAVIEVIRRDAAGDEDFVVTLVLTEANLPDPRARFLRVDLRDRMVRALFTIGLPLKASRVVQLGPIRVTAAFDGRRLRLTDYLGTYAKGDGGFHPFFLRSGPEGDFRTAPEDGSAIELQAGDQLLAGATLYLFQN